MVERTRTRHGASGVMPGAPLPKSKRLARLKRVADAMEVKRVRVEPANDDMRRLLKHPNGMAFRAHGSVEWPLDKFTKRRLADHSIKLADKSEEKDDAKERTERPKEDAP